MDRFALPDGYSLIRAVNLQKDKKLAVLINLAALVIAGAMIMLGLVMVPGSFVLSGAGSLIRPLGMLAAVVVYMVLHEFVHGIFIKMFSGKFKMRYGLYVGLIPCVISF